MQRRERQVQRDLEMHNTYRMSIRASPGVVSRAKGTPAPLGPQNGASGVGYPERHMYGNEREKEAWLAVSSPGRGFCVQFVYLAQAHLPWTLTVVVVVASFVAAKVLSQGQHMRWCIPPPQRTTRIPSVSSHGGSWRAADGLWHARVLSNPVLGFLLHPYAVLLISRERGMLILFPRVRVCVT